MKKIVSLLLVFVLLFSINGVSVYAASADKTATFTLKASAADASASGQAQDKKDYINTANKTVYNSKDSKTINVYPGQVVWVTIHLKTGSKYYAGDLQAYLFYTTNVFKSTDQGAACYVWDAEGKYSGICSRTGAPFSKMVADAINQTYPASWSDAQKKAHGFYSVVMYPNPNVTTKVKASIDDDLVTVPIYVRSDAKVGEKGSIYLPAEIVKSASNPEGKFMLSNYVNGDILGSNVPYAKDYGFDLSKAKLDFVVCSKDASVGDVNNDKKVNSSDALLVLQYSTGNLTLNSNQKSQADVDKNSKINSNDALKILQYAAGLIKKF